VILTRRRGDAEENAEKRGTEKRFGVLRVVSPRLRVMKEFWWSDE
jgi:hypothetical protein